MSRIASGDTIQVRPTNNVYTALAAAAFVLVLTGLILFIVAADKVLPADNGLFVQ